MSIVITVLLEMIILLNIGREYTRGLAENGRLELWLSWSLRELVYLNKI